MGKIIKLRRLSKIKLCKGCSLKSHARNQVIGRGKIPAKLLLIGDSPDKTEDLLGELLVGKDGDLLLQMLQEASKLANVPIPSYYLTNCTLCRAWIWNPEREDYGFNREPNKLEVLSCMQNVMEISKAVRPELVVFLGRTAESYYKKEFPGASRITHPAYHLKFGGRASPTYLQDVRTLSEVFLQLRGIR